MASSYCKVIMVGNLTRDPELRYTPNGTAVCGCCVAINHSWTSTDGEKREEVAFVDFDAWGATAENLAQYKKKGDQILVDGRIKQDSWDDKETHQKRTKLKVVAERIQFLGSKPDGEEGGGGGRRQPPRDRQTRSAEAPQKDANDNGAQSDPQEDDVPF